jgi:enediyne biosynthesis protein E3
MSTWRALRRRVLTPNTSAVRLDVRGFHVKSVEARDLLETVGISFLTGYAYAAESRTADEAEDRLDDLAVRFRGFAYEGAAMAFAVRDALPLGRHDHVARFLAGRGSDHVYMTYIGVGWAMARLPQVTWSKLRVDDPLLNWLVLDGYGFHQAYFDTQRYVHGQFEKPAFRWPHDTAAGYAHRAIDQGIGRAMWFVGGTDAALVTQMIQKFPQRRRADLYSGAGLAATYAGGADEAEMLTFWKDAGEFRPQVAQGSAFAAGARVKANLVVPHNDLATQIFCGMTTVDASKVTDDTLIDLKPDGDVPSYEVWRQRIADSFASTERC